ncbi:unnamed protein product [Ectocarpus sp. 13 AM-2016]
MAAMEEASSAPPGTIGTAPHPATARGQGMATEACLAPGAGAVAGAHGRTVVAAAKGQGAMMGATTATADQGVVVSLGEGKSGGDGCWEVPFFRRWPEVWAVSPTSVHTTIEADAVHPLFDRKGSAGAAVSGKGSGSGSGGGGDGGSPAGGSMDPRQPAAAGMDGSSSKGHRILITGRNFAHPVAAADASTGGLCNSGGEERVIGTSGSGSDSFAGEASGRRKLEQAGGRIAGNGDHLADDGGGGGDGGEVRRSKTRRVIVRFGRKVTVPGKVLSDTLVEAFAPARSEIGFVDVAVVVVAESGAAGGDLASDSVIATTAGAEQHGWRFGRRHAPMLRYRPPPPPFPPLPGATKKSSSSPLSGKGKRGRKKKKRRGSSETGPQTGPKTVDGDDADYPAAAAAEGNAREGGAAARGCGGEGDGGGDGKEEVVVNGRYGPVPVEDDEEEAGGGDGQGGEASASASSSSSEEMEEEEEEEEEERRRSWKRLRGCRRGRLVGVGLAGEVLPAGRGGGRSSRRTMMTMMMMVMMVGSQLQLRQKKKYQQQEQQQKELKQELQQKDQQQQ